MPQRVCKGVEEFESWKTLANSCQPLTTFVNPYQPLPTLKAIYASKGAQGW